MFHLKKINGRAAVAAFTAFCVGFTQIAIAAPSFSISNPEVSLPAAAKLAQSTQIKVPGQIASLEQFHQGSGKTIFHIQSAHGHFQAEKNIEALLHHLEKDYGVKTILVEGAENQLNPEIINFYPKDREHNRKVTDVLTRHAVLQGLETYLLDSKDSKGYGIEDRAAYDRGLAAFATVIRGSDESRRFLSELDQSVEKLAAKLFSGELRSFEKRVEKRILNEVPFDAYLGQLKAAAEKHLTVDLADASYQVLWPMLVRVFTIEKLEKRINPAAFENEKKAFLKAIKPYTAKASDTQGSIYSEIENLLNLKDLSVRLPNPETSDLFMSLVAALPKNFDYEKFRSVTSFCGLLILKSELSAETLMAEIEKIESDIADHLAETAAAKKLVSILKDYQLLKKVYTLELTPVDFEKISKNKSQLLPSKIIERLNALRLTPNASQAQALSAVRLTLDGIEKLDKLFNQARSFYKIARERDQIMLRRIEERLKETSSDRVAVITGGFHSGPFSDYFTNHGYSYALITPKITGTDIDGRNDYVRTMMMYAKAQRSAVRGQTSANASASQQNTWTVTGDPETASALLVPAATYYLSGSDAGVVMGSLTQTTTGVGELSTTTTTVDLDNGTTVITGSFTATESLTPTIAARAVPSTPTLRNPVLTPVSQARSGTGSWTANFKSAFTIIESLVSLSVILVLVGAVLALVRSNIDNHASVVAWTALKSPILKNANDFDKEFAYQSQYADWKPTELEEKAARAVWNAVRMSPKEPSHEAAKHAYWITWQAAREGQPDLEQVASTALLSRREARRYALKFEPGVSNEAITVYQLKKAGEENSDPELKRILTDLGIKNTPLPKDWAVTLTMDAVRKNGFIYLTLAGQTITSHYGFSDLKDAGLEAVSSAEHPVEVIPPGELLRDPEISFTGKNEITLFFPRSETRDFRAIKADVLRAWDAIPASYKIRQGLNERTAMQKRIFKLPGYRLLLQASFNPAMLKVSLNYALLFLIGDRTEPSVNRLFQLAEELQGVAPGSEIPALAGIRSETRANVTAVVGGNDFFVKMSRRQLLSMTANTITLLGFAAFLGGARVWAEEGDFWFGNSTPENLAYTNGQIIKLVDGRQFWLFVAAQDLHIQTTTDLVNWTTEPAEVLAKGNAAIIELPRNAIGSGFGRVVRVPASVSRSAAPRAVAANVEEVNSLPEAVQAALGQSAFVGRPRVIVQRSESRTPQAIFDELVARFTKPSEPKYEMARLVISESPKVTAEKVPGYDAIHLVARSGVNPLGTLRIELIKEEDKPDRLELSRSYESIETEDSAWTGPKKEGFTDQAEVNRIVDTAHAWLMGELSGQGLNVVELNGANRWSISDARAESRAWFGADVLFGMKINRQVLTVALSAPILFPAAVLLLPAASFWAGLTLGAVSLVAVVWLSGGFVNKLSGYSWMGWEKSTTKPKDAFDDFAANAKEYASKSKGSWPASTEVIVKMFRLLDIDFDVSNLSPEDQTELLRSVFSYFTELKSRNGHFTITEMWSGAASRMQKGKLPELLIKAMKAQPDDFVNQAAFDDDDKGAIEKLSGDWRAYITGLDPEDDHQHAILNRVLFEAKALLPVETDDESVYRNFIYYHMTNVKQANDLFEEMGLGRPFIAQFMANEKYYPQIMAHLARHQFYGLKTRVVDKDGKEFELTADNWEKVHDIVHDDMDSEVMVFNQPLIPRIAAAVETVDKQWTEDQMLLKQLADLKKQIADIEGVNSSDERLTGLREQAVTVKNVIMLPDEATYQYARNFAEKNQGTAIRDAKAMSPGGHGWYHLSKLLTDKYRKVPQVVTQKLRGVEYDYVHNVDNMAMLNDAFLLIFGKMLREKYTVMLEASRKPSTERGSGGGAFVWIKDKVSGLVKMLQLEYASIRASIGRDPITGELISPDYKAEDEEQLNQGDNKVPVNNASMITKQTGLYESLLENDGRFEAAILAAEKGDYKALADLVGPVQNTMGVTLTLKPIKDPNVTDHQPHQVVMSLVMETFAWDAQKGKDQKVGVAMTPSTVDVDEKTAGITPEDVRFNPTKDRSAFANELANRVRKALLLRVKSGKIFEKFAASRSETRAMTPRSELRLTVRALLLAGLLAFSSFMARGQTPDSDQKILDAFFRQHGVYLVLGSGTGEGYAAGLRGYFGTKPMSEIIEAEFKAPAKQSGLPALIRKLKSEGVLADVPAGSGVTTEQVEKKLKDARLSPMAFVTYETLKLVEDKYAYLLLSPAERPDFVNADESQRTILRLIIAKGYFPVLGGTGEGEGVINGFLKQFQGKDFKDAAVQNAFDAAFDRDRDAWLRTKAIKFLPARNELRQPGGRSELRYSFKVGSRQYLNLYYDGKAVTFKVAVNSSGKIDHQPSYNRIRLKHQVFGQEDWRETNLRERSFIEHYPFGSDIPILVTFANAKPGVVELIFKDDGKGAVRLVPAVTASVTNQPFQGGVSAAKDLQYEGPQWFGVRAIFHKTTVFVSLVIGVGTFFLLPGAWVTWVSLITAFFVGVVSYPVMGYLQNTALNVDMKGINKGRLPSGGTRAEVRQPLNADFFTKNTALARWTDSRNDADYKHRSINADGHNITVSFVTAGAKKGNFEITLKKGEEGNEGASVVKIVWIESSKTLFVDGQKYEKIKASPDLLFDSDTSTVEISFEEYPAGLEAAKRTFESSTNAGALNISIVRSETRLTQDELRFLTNNLVVKNLVTEQEIKDERLTLSHVTFEPNYLPGTPRILVYFSVDGSPSKLRALHIYPSSDELFYHNGIFGEAPFKLTPAYLDVLLPALRGLPADQQQVAGGTDEDLQAAIAMLGAPRAEKRSVEDLAAEFVRYSVKTTQQDFVEVSVNVLDANNNVVTHTAKVPGGFFGGGVGYRFLGGVSPVNYLAQFLAIQIINSGMISGVKQIAFDITAQGPYADGRIAAAAENIVTNPDVLIDAVKAQFNRPEFGGDTHKALRMISQNQPIKYLNPGEEIVIPKQPRTAVAAPKPVDFTQGDAIGVDVGGTGAKIVVIRNGKRIAERRIDWAAGENGRSIATRLKTAILELRGEHSVKNANIYIAVPGPVDDAEKIIDMPNLNSDHPGAVEAFEDLGSDLAAEGLVARFQNDANASAFNQVAVLGLNQDNVIFGTLGTGHGFAVSKQGVLSKGTQEAHSIGYIKDTDISTSPLLHEGTGILGDLEAYARLQRIYDYTLSQLSSAQNASRFDGVRSEFEKAGFEKAPLFLGKWLEGQNATLKTIAETVFAEYGSHLAMLYRLTAKTEKVNDWKVVWTGGMTKSDAIVSAIKKGLDIEGLAQQGLNLTVQVGDDAEFAGAMGAAYLGIAAAQRSEERAPVATTTVARAELKSTQPIAATTAVRPAALTTPAVQPVDIEQRLFVYLKYLTGGVLPLLQAAQVRAGKAISAVKAVVVQVIGNALVLGTVQDSNAIANEVLGAPNVSISFGSGFAAFHQKSVANETRDQFKPGLLTVTDFVGAAIENPRAAMAWIKQTAVNARISPDAKIFLVAQNADEKSEAFDRLIPELRKKGSGFSGSVADLKGLLAQALNVLDSEDSQAMARFKSPENRNQFSVLRLGFDAKAGKTLGGLAGFLFEVMNEGRHLKGKAVWAIATVGVLLPRAVATAAGLPDEEAQAQLTTYFNGGAQGMGLSFQNGIYKFSSLRTLLQAIQTAALIAYQA